MRWDDIALMGALHGVAALVAVITGAYVLFAQKGTAAHRKFGWWYAVAMLIANTSIFAVYHYDIKSFSPFDAGPNRFGVFHWEAIVTLGFVAAAVFSASRQRHRVWAYVHPLTMLTSYYLLIGGFINQLFLRINVLTATNPDFAARARTIPLSGKFQIGAFWIFVALFVYFIIKVARSKTRKRPAMTDILPAE